MATLYHWGLPSALQLRGGWRNREIVAAFAHYADVIAQRFQGRVTKFITLNEPQCVAWLGYGTGEYAPGLKLGAEEVARVYHHLSLAHSAAQRAIKAACGGGAQVGVASTGRLCYPERDAHPNREAAYRASFALSSSDWIFTHGAFLDPLCLRRCDDSAPEAVRRFVQGIAPADWRRMERPDFLGLNIYHGMAVDESGAPVEPYPGFPRTATKWRITPEVLHYGPLQIARRYGLPMYITENGISCNDFVHLDGKVHDPNRMDFLRRYLLELRRAITEGADVRGYFHWSFLDNFEWTQGCTERFGLIHVDYRTQKRTPKDSAAWYAQVIESNGARL